MHPLDLNREILSLGGWLLQHLQDRVRYLSSGTENSDNTVPIDSLRFVLSFNFRAHHQVQLNSNQRSDS